MDDPLRKPELGSSTPSRPRPRWQRLLFLLLAWTSLALGLIGIVVPGLPTTVFVLIAAWAAMHGSPKLHDRLLAHPRFGPVIRDWRASGAVSRKAKWMASLSMAVCAAVIWLVPTTTLAATGASGIMALVLLWLWQRPEPAAR